MGAAPALPRQVSASHCGEDECSHQVQQHGAAGARGEAGASVAPGGHGDPPWPWVRISLDQLEETSSKY